MMDLDCPLCGGKKAAGTTSFTVDLGFGVVVVRHVPAQVCSLCGEAWIEDATAEQLETVVESARLSHQAVKVAEFTDIAA
ncbi:type II toxin-antitoxin system MqsA family antitoxin [Candidatus Methylospira mobilis]|uniref:Type II toxin-antitoxin system MqsA family antitoxin n=1 Tax=Candidatus Methylospira mobilis TaxID=1808979 RepID=A0A5Q0BGT9_9GAMM|nr:type II toxin-antitoxin system MqsA family antitoxin [Candidatus Methylospira mobilis]QFY41338.1 type II toxin-antitoxin system MqsA family antitoxin [Candidatus Methylospira mobilis]WNV05434.1 type II toxin-antitoxin system MqsA family antitoxin [Candidatus Methylospira mobilis]